MHRPAHRTASLLAGALVAAALAAAPASADFVTVADATAENVTSYGRTFAWSQRADDGTYRLRIFDTAGRVLKPDIRGSSVPFDPDIGPTADSKRMIVYSRCAKGSATRSCDIYAYDVAREREKKVTALSGTTTSEVGPSFFKGSIAFGRVGKRGGLYFARAGEGARRINIAPARETDLSATRVIARLGSGAQTSMMLVRRGHDDSARIVDRAGRANGSSDNPRLTSPVLTRYRAFWLEQMPRSGTSLVRTVSVRRATDVAESVTRPFDIVVNAIALGASRRPELYSASTGIVRLDPGLQFGG